MTLRVTVSVNLVATVITFLPQRTVIVSHKSSHRGPGGRNLTEVTSMGDKKPLLMRSAFQRGDGSNEGEVREVYFLIIMILRPWNCS